MVRIGVVGPAPRKVPPALGAVHVVAAAVLLDRRLALWASPHAVRKASLLRGLLPRSVDFPLVLAHKAHGFATTGLGIRHADALRLGALDDAVPSIPQHPLALAEVLPQLAQVPVELDRIPYGDHLAAARNHAVDVVPLPGSRHLLGLDHQVAAQALLAGQVAAGERPEDRRREEAAADAAAGDPLKLFARVGIQVLRKRLGKVTLFQERRTVEAAISDRLLQLRSSPLEERLLQFSS
mmetsp:Transcript_61072/g.192062  ORF Transcript_61072/g.192062 Transcript_61072/m.192062 type:complete len:238 (+) Transcript_61072:180-893(+)